MRSLFVVLVVWSFISLLAGSQPVLATGGVLLDPNSFTSLGPLVVSSGSVLFDTTTGVVSVSGSPLGGSGVVNANGTGLTAFTFSSISISSGVTASYQGANALALLSKGNITIAGVLSGDDLGALGGAKAQNGQGQGPGSTGTNSGGGGGGSFGNSGGKGGDGTTLSSGGPTGSVYGNADLSQLDTFLVGSGGGGAGDPVLCTSSYQGGAGGGGLVLIALGSVNLNNANISAKGKYGDIASSGHAGNGGGSGGAVLVVAPAYGDNGATINVVGGDGSSAETGTPPPNCMGKLGGGGGGGGGRITFVTGSPSSTSQPYSSVGGIGSGGGGTGGSGGLATTFYRPFVTLVAGVPDTSNQSIPFTATLAVGTASNYVWDFGDSVNANTNTGTIIHAYNHAGPFTIVVTATMTNTGTLSSNSLSVNVVGAPLYLPLVVQ